MTAVVHVGCSSPHAADVDPGLDASRALGFAEPIHFLAVGPDGGPLDIEDRAGEALPLADALRRAVATDPSLQAALARVRAASADADQARLLPNPLLSFVVRWGPGESQIEASLAQDLIQSLQAPRRASAADNRLRKAGADAVTVAIDVATELQETYLDAQAAAALAPLFRERLDLLQRLETVARARLDAGEGTRSDLATLEAQRVELEVEIDQASLVEREARLHIARLIGEPSSPATWSLDPWTAPLPPREAVNAWIDIAIQHRPEIQSVVWTLRALGDDEAASRFLPWEGGGVGPDLNRDGDWTIGPSVATPLPVFDTGQARKARIVAEQMEARHDLTRVRRTVVEEIRVAHQTLEASTANLRRVRDDLVPLQEQRRRLAEETYRAGQSDVTSLYLADQDLRMAQARAIEIERQAARALVRLQRAAGGPGIAPDPQSAYDDATQAQHPANHSALPDRIGTN